MQFLPFCVEPQSPYYVKTQSPHHWSIISLKHSLQGKRGGRMWRRRTEIYETTPDASGNVWNELEPMIGKKITTKQSVETLHATSTSGLKPVPIHSIHCSGQRGDN